MYVYGIKNTFLQCSLHIKDILIYTHLFSVEDSLAVRMHVAVCVHVEADVGCLPQSLSTLCMEAGRLT